MNQLYYGDNLEIMRKYVADESVDLCYIDPPLNSNTDYNILFSKENIVDNAQTTAFTDSWSWNLTAEMTYTEIIEQGANIFSIETVEFIKSMQMVIGKCPLLAYLVFMAIRINEIHRVLKPTGSLYLHCDPTAGHYLKLLLDCIFKPRGGELRREIIWYLDNVSGFKGQAPNWIRDHDTIFYYTKSKNKIFNKIFDMSAYPSGYEKKFCNDDGDGRKYMKRNGRKQYLDKLKGKPFGDVWRIPFINNMAKERLGYPTQKPLALLERIIKASSNEGDVIFDCFCGCGTTVAAAQNLNRKWLGIDITYNAIELILNRLENTYGGEIFNEIVLNGIPKDFESAKALAEKKDDRLRKEFEKWAIITYTNNRAFINDKKGGDGGIDGVKNILDKDTDGNTIYKRAIYQVKSSKNLSPSVIRDLDSTVSNNNAEVGILLTLYPMENLQKEASKYGTYKNNLLGKEYQRIQVVEIMDIIEHKLRCDLPAESILKTAERVNNAIQQKLL